MADCRIERSVCKEWRSRKGLIGNIGKGKRRIGRTKAFEQKVVSNELSVHEYTITK